jgi:hypothetical protein
VSRDRIDEAWANTVRTAESRARRGLRDGCLGRAPTGGDLVYLAGHHIGQSHLNENGGAIEPPHTPSQNGCLCSDCRMRRVLRGMGYAADLPPVCRHNIQDILRGGNL